MARVATYRWAGAALTALGLFATAALAQPPRPADPLQSAKAQQRIAEQKAESDVLQIIENADRLAKGNYKEKAAQQLRAAKQSVQFALGISEAARTRLSTMLDQKLAAVEGRVIANPNPNPGVKLDPKGADVKAAQKLAVERGLSELKAIDDGIEKIKDFQARGMNDHANFEIAKLAKAYPNNPAVIVLGQSDTLRGRVADAAEFQRMQSERMVKLNQQLMIASLPAVNDVEFPKNWKELSERRLKNTTIQLSAKEKKIIEALDKPYSVDFKERPLEEALQDLSTMFDQPLLIDKKSLEDLGLDLKRGSTLQAKGISGRTVLRSVLGAQGLTFIVKDEAVQIMTVEKARTMMTTRVYYLGDLVKGTGDFGDIRFGPQINFLQQQENVRVLMESIRKIDPLSWGGPDTGGAGTVVYHAPSQSIIVRNSAEVHHSLGGAIYGRK